MKGSLIILFSLVFSYCTAQTVMTADKTEVKIGDQIKATITTDLSDGREWRNLSDIWPDSMQGIEVVSGPVIDQTNPASTRYTWNVSVFDTGWVMIPPLNVAIRFGNNLDTFVTNEIKINVLSVEPDSTGLAGIKDVIKQPFSIGYYKKFLPHLLILLIMLAILYYWWRQRKQKADLPVTPEPEPLPHEWALKALADLEQKKLWQSGDIKEHYTILTAILREYLERRYGINAMEQTSDEILNQLRHQSLDSQLMNDTEQLLSVADLIKFAKADPGTNIHAETIQRVRHFVLQTMNGTAIINEASSNSL